MARTEDPKDQASTSKEVPEQRNVPEQEAKKARPELTPPPSITVIGHTEKQIAVHLSWKSGMVTVSPSRLRFLRDDLGMDVSDDPENYLF